MTWDAEERQRRMRNYSIMLKAALVCLVFALGTTLVGGIRAITHGDVLVLAYGLLFVVWCTGSAWLTLDSTVKIIESETADSSLSF